MEEWRDVVGFEGKYQVSNLGRVRSQDHYAMTYHGPRISRGKILSQCVAASGYVLVMLSDKNCRHASRGVHRLVAEAFIPNPDKLPQVNHKDEVKTNNCVENLEWCTVEYNVKYGTRLERSYETLRKNFKNIYQINKDTGEIIRRWDTAMDVQRELGIKASFIYRICKHKGKSAGGYVWRYADEYDKEHAV